jgi:hypothetical protein
VLGLDRNTKSVIVIGSTFCFSQTTQKNMKDLNLVLLITLPVISIIAFFAGTSFPNRRKIFEIKAYAITNSLLHWYTTKHDLVWKCIDVYPSKDLGGMFGDTEITYLIEKGVERIKICHTDKKLSIGDSIIFRLKHKDDHSSWNLGTTEM